MNTEKPCIQKELLNLQNKFVEFQGAAGNWRRHNQSGTPTERQQTSRLLIEKSIAIKQSLSKIESIVKP